VVHPNSDSSETRVGCVAVVTGHAYDMGVECHAEGERVRMVVTADAHKDPEMTRLASQTLESQFCQFDSLLATRRA
jgi:hypothetical protein